jgi:hypothetical protein
MSNILGRQGPNHKPAPCILSPESTNSMRGHFFQPANRNYSGTGKPEFNQTGTKHFPGVFVMFFSLV